MKRPGFTPQDLLFFCDRNEGSSIFSVLLELNLRISMREKRGRAQPETRCTDAGDAVRVRGCTGGRRGCLGGGAGCLRQMPTTVR